MEIATFRSARQEISVIIFYFLRFGTDWTLFVGQARIWSDGFGALVQGWQKTSEKLLRLSLLCGAESSEFMIIGGKGLLLESPNCRTNLAA